MLPLYDIRLILTAHLLFASADDSIPSHLAAPYSAKSDDLLKAEDALWDCESNPACAGLTAKDGHARYMHSFIPDDSCSTYPWETLRSKKKFVLHRGRAISESSGGRGVLDIVSGMSVDDAISRCSSLDDCAGLTFPVKSDHLLFPNNITLVSYVSFVEGSPDDMWRTYLSNYPERAHRIDHSRGGVKLDRDLFFAAVSFGTCCKRHDANSDRIPTTDDIRAMDKLERISCDISREDFEKQYETKRRPVMLVGCDENWLARERWTFEELAERFDNNTRWRVELDIPGNDGETIREAVKWKHIVKWMSTGKRFYIFDELKSSHSKVLLEDYTTPGPFHNIDLHRHLFQFPYEDGPMRWFAMGTKYSGSLAHIDPHATDAWNSVVRGQKWWVLYPRTFSKRLQVKGREILGDDFDDDLECNDDCSVTNYTPLDWYSSVAFDTLRNDYGSEHAMHVLQVPGETIYVPHGLLHSVLNMEDTFSVTSNYGAPGNLENVWKDLVLGGPNYEWIEVFCRTFNDHQRAQIYYGKYWDEKFLKWDEEKFDATFTDFDCSNRDIFKRV